ncbi:MAG: 4-hydroxybenzoate octaprenyltransferase [Betaproteobacteria bacterium]|nr:4-hydroxybenzoate octaprenyltransferase [Betaproteobacteria bacterium]
MTLKERLDAYERLMRLDKPIGILLLLWPTLWALWLSAPGAIRLDVLLIFVLGTALMRSAGCIINDFADREFDPHVERTRDRPLASGLVSLREAFVLTGVLLLLAFALVLQLNRLAVYLSFFAVAITVIYPFLKRVFVFPQAGLGIAFSFGVPMAYAAQKGALPAAAWVLMLATFFWIIAYDTEYAMVDRNDDIKLGVHSSAILLGRRDIAAVMTCHALFIGILGAFGAWQRLGAPYYGGLLVAAGLAVYQYRLIQDRGRDGCFRAFLHNNWMGAAVFAGILFARMIEPYIVVMPAR